MTNLPRGWRSATILELAGPKGLVSDGDWVESKDQNPAGEVRLVQLADIGDGRFLDRSHRFMDAETARRLQCTFLQEGDVLIARMPEPLGRACLFPTIAQDAVTVVDVLIWRPDSDLSAATPRWLMHAINSPDVRGRILLQSGGTTRVRIAGGKLKELPLSVPPIEEQQRISAKLDHLFAGTAAASANLSKIPELIEVYRQAMFSRAFSGELSSQWRAKYEISEGRMVHLRDVVESFQYGTSAKSARKGRVPVLRMGNIQGGKLDWSDLVFTSDSEEIEKYRLLPNDVLFNRTNSPELVGKTALFEGDRDAIAAGYLIRIRCGPDVVPQFLTYLLNSPLGRSYCWKVKTDGVSQSNINAKKLGDFEFWLPHVSEQEEIVRQIERSLSWIDRVALDRERALQQIAVLDDTIARMAYRGTLIAQDAGDESIEGLLAEIAASRKKMPPKIRVPRKKSGIKTMPTVSKDVAAKLLLDSDNWPVNGLPFKEILGRVVEPYDGIKEALYALLSASPPKLEQHFDPDEKCILIRRVVDAS